MIIIMLGAPGTGKGTVASMLAENLDIPQISTGDIFRKAISEKTELGIEADKYISQGNLVPDELTIKIVEERLKEEDTKNGAILDGFPRTENQAKALEKFLESQNKKVDIAINLTTEEEEIIERIVNRRVCSNQECKAVYNTTLSPSKIEGICDKCGGTLVQRKDDNEETIRKRLNTYYATSEPIIDFYKEKNVLYPAEVSKKVNKMGKDVAEDLIKMLKK